MCAGVCTLFVFSGLILCCCLLYQITFFLMLSLVSVHNHYFSFKTFNVVCCSCLRSVAGVVSGERGILTGSYNGYRHTGHHPPAQHTSVSGGRRDSCHGRHRNQHRTQKGRFSQSWQKENCHPCSFSFSSFFLIHYGIYNTLRYSTTLLFLVCKYLVSVSPVRWNNR